jgi:succinylarginine dihydrolase
MRLAASHRSPGVHVFVYGRDMENPNAHQPAKYTPRQTKQSLEMIAAVHRLPTERTLFLQQHPDAVDAGVFHNDVIAMSNEYLLIAHEKAWVRQGQAVERLKTMLPRLHYLEVKDAEIPLELAVKSYLFNSQLVTLPDGSMLLIAPSECEENGEVKRWINRLVADHRNPVNAVRYLNLRESMKNGGGPACLRLRAVLKEAELNAANPRYRYTPTLHARLAEIIEKTYRDRLQLRDLADPAFAREAWAAQRRIMEVFE